MQDDLFAAAELGGPSSTRSSIARQGGVEGGVPSAQVPPLKGEITNRYEMERAYYEFKGTGSCRSCNAPIEWWVTTNKKRMPFDAAKNPRGSQMYLDERAVCHFVTCPNADQHRKQKSEAAPSSTGSSIAGQGGVPSTELQTEEVLSREAAWFAKRHNARIAVILCDRQLQAFAVRKDVNIQQVIPDLVAIGEAVKKYLEAKHAES